MAAETWLIEIVVFMGAFIGNFLQTMIPYWKEKRKLELDDVSLIFDKQFLMTAAITAVGSIMVIGSTFPVFLKNVDPAASLLITFLSAATLAFSSNGMVNWAVGSGKITQQAREQALQKKVQMRLRE